MKLELCEFQQTAVARLREEASWAKREARDRSKAQAVVLASPTGSGKTIITTQLIEDILNGTDEIPAEPDAVFLWLSDQPELNEQSRKKIAASSSRLRDQDLVIVASSFDRRIFEGVRSTFSIRKSSVKTRALSARPISANIRFGKRFRTPNEKSATDSISSSTKRTVG